MKLRFVKVNPSGNTTVFLLDPIPAELYKTVADKIMQHTGVGAEQIGFVFPDQIPPHLEMMGGEFCCNASRSFGAWLKLRHKDFTTYHGLDETDSVQISVSGSESVLTVDLMPNESENSCNAGICLPCPKQILHGSNEDLGEYSIVVSEGIVHVILYDRSPSAALLDPAKHLLAVQGIGFPCLGLMFYETASCSLTPLVYVSEISTLVWENSCGSGSAAIAAALADKRKSSYKKEIRQPGGVLNVSAEYTEHVERIYLSGPVEITAAGYLYI